MARMITLDALLKGCADDSFDDGIRIDAELVPLAGPGGPVKPAVYEVASRQRGWRHTLESRDPRRFNWPAWHQPLDSAGIDALMDTWNPERKRAWPRVGIHAAWRSVRFQPRGSADTTRAFGAERL